jgi:hypothetical protein
MSVVFVEALPKGTECEITDYVVETEVNRVLAAFKTRGDAIFWAKTHGHTPHVVRVRHLNPGHWQALCCPAPPFERRSRHSSAPLATRFCARHPEAAEAHL